MMVAYLFGKDLWPIFCEEDQVKVHLKYAGSAVADIGFLHRPRLISPCDGFKPTNTN